MAIVYRGHGDFGHLNRRQHPQLNSDAPVVLLFAQAGQRQGSIAFLPCLTPSPPRRDDWRRLALISRGRGVTPHFVRRWAKPAISACFRLLPASGTTIRHRWATGGAAPTLPRPSLAPGVAFRSQVFSYRAAIP